MCILILYVPKHTHTNIIRYLSFSLPSLSPYLTLSFDRIIAMVTKGLSGCWWRTPPVGWWVTGVLRLWPCCTTVDSSSWSRERWGPPASRLHFLFPLSYQNKKQCPTRGCVLPFPLFFLAVALCDCALRACPCRWRWRSLCSRRRRWRLCARASTTYCCWARTSLSPGTKGHGLLCRSRATTGYLMHAHTHTHAHSCTHTHTLTRAHTHIHVYTHKYTMYKQPHTYIHTCIQTGILIHMDTHKLGMSTHATYCTLHYTQDAMLMYWPTYSTYIKNSHK